MTSPIPNGLGKTGRRMWKGLTGDYELRVDELVILESLCREADTIDRLESELASSELEVNGSQGQPVASPLLVEIRQHRATMVRLRDALRLPDESGSASSKRSAAARDLANARWSARGA
jgi:hypothetical protein